MKLPCLEEMGDVGAALDTLLKLQAEYARRTPEVSRAMRDVARSALATEIERYVLMRLKRLDDAQKALRTLQGYNEHILALKINYRPDDHLAIIKAGLNGWDEQFAASNASQPKGDSNA